MQLSVKKGISHLLILLGFIVISLIYFSPVLKGKKIIQSDIVHYTGMAKQQNDFRKQNNKETYWTNSAFGGMPTYQLGAKYPHNYIKKLDLALRFLPRPADYLFLYFLGFYILMLSLKIDFKLAALGALAFGFSTYLVIIIGVGHNSKAHAIAYMPLVLSGILLTFQRKYIFGFLITAIAMGLELVANHYQMTYYLMLLVIVLGIVYLVDAYKNKMLPHYFKSVGLLLVAVIIAIGLNATGILATQEYVKESTRGKSELTINADGSPKEQSTGLSKEYITDYSYGIVETFNLFIPRFFGGGNSEELGKDSNIYKAYRKLGAPPSQAAEQAKQAPMYWGDQPGVEAPAYVGAVVLFLFVFALFLVKGKLKWWLVTGVIVSLLLSYGKNLGFLTNFFIDYFPMYNKFRAVSSIQVILELCIPILAIFGLSRLFNTIEKKEDKLKALKYTSIITGGIAVLLLLLGLTESFSFIGIRDAQYRQAYGLDFVDAIRADRKAIFTTDTLRTILLVVFSAGVIYLFLKKKLNEIKLIIAFAVLIVFDLVQVDRRYVNTDNFVSAAQVAKPFSLNKADKQILKDKSHFRVLDVTNGAARSSYFHNSLNGYHAAKLKRFDEVFDFYIARNNINVLSMLNTKYIIAEDKGKIFPFTNKEANGNAWFIEQLQKEDSANEEIKALDSLDTKKIAVISSLQRKLTKGTLKGHKNLKTNYSIDSIAKIKVLEYKPNYIKYESNNTHNGFAVFSEIFYGEGWNAYLDNEYVPHYRVNYLLRGLETPKGNHTITFKFEPKVVETGSKIALASSVLLGILLITGLFFEFRKKEELEQ